MPALTKNLLATCFVIISLFCSITCIANEDNDIQVMLTDIDRQHQNFTTDFFSLLLKTPYYKTKKFSSVDVLKKQLKILTHDDIKQTALIINNLDMIKDNYDDMAIFTLIKHLLNANAFNEAQQLIDNIEDQGDVSLSTYANYLLADFYFKRQQWQQTLQHLSENINDLDTELFYHALLIKGISYQKQTEHYLAIKEYEKIPKQSTSYQSAQLNLAIANIRQGWWTDAHILIKQLIKSQGNTLNETTLNRLYITLAYSQLNQGYYRTARTTFHQIGINSKYATQAIIGIALTAVQQGDDIGALNIVRFLKQKKQQQLPVYESHLLMPFIYEKSNQLIAASVGYSEAIDYYQKTIATLQKTINTPLDLTKPPIQINSNNIAILDAIRVDFSPDYPAYYFINRNKMQTYQTYIKQPSIREKYNQLHRAYQQLTDRMCKNILQHRVDNLTSYLNQSRYGLARLFDNNTAK